jgi:hypothetical protein
MKETNVTRFGDARSKRSNVETNGTKFGDARSKHSNFETNVAVVDLNELNNIREINKYVG